MAQEFPFPFFFNPNEGEQDDPVIELPSEELKQEALKRPRPAPLEEETPSPSHVSKEVEKGPSRPLLVSLDPPSDEVLETLSSQKEDSPLLFDPDFSALLEENPGPQISAGEVNPSLIKFQPSEKDLNDHIQSTVISKTERSKTLHGELDPKKTFNNFIVGPSNTLAYASAMAVAQKPGQAYPLLFIHSTPGLGKTHLLNAIGNKIRETVPQMKLIAISANEFMLEMMEAISHKQSHIFRRKYSEKTDILLIDDIQDIRGRMGTQKELVPIIAELQQKKKQLVFAANCHPNEIGPIDPLIATRFNSGLIVDLTAPTAETRLSILKQKIIEEDLFIPHDVLVYMAQNLKGHIRELEGALIRLGAYSSVMQVDIDLSIAKDLLKPLEGKQCGEAGQKTAEQIIKATSRYFRIPEVDIISSVRHKNITYARHLAIFLCHKHLTLTLEQIGHYFNNRDHTTVLYAVSKIKKMLQKSTEVQHNLIEIEKQF